MATSTSRRNQTVVTTQAETFTLKEFCAKHNFIQVNNEVSVNKNGYPFVTFIDGDNKAENIYFASTISEDYTAGQPISVKDGFFNELIIIMAETKNNGVLPKLCKEGGNRRESLADLL